jgi:uncharacterized protein YbbK (DUF523 family)
MAKVLVSACLLGRACRHDGTDRLSPPLVDALEDENVGLVAFCPEEAGGLGTPRPPAKITGGDGDAVLDGSARVVTEDGEDRTDAFVEGARQALAQAREAGCEVAYLKEKSPSCGCALVHTDKGLVRGSGVTAALLRRNGIATISVD